MYSIMLVEDESAVREGILKKIDWQSHGFELAGAFENGKQAADALEKAPVDAVITDVNMPVMDGLALARFISETAPKTIVVILTGFGEFTYAQTAIRYKVHEYVLKPVTAKQLGQLLDKLCVELDSRRGESGADYGEIRAGILRAVKLLNQQAALEGVDNFIERLLSGAIGQGEYMLQLQKLAIPLMDYANTEKLGIADEDYASGDILERLASCATLGDSRELLRGYVRAVIGAGLARGDGAGRLSALAADYIKKNYADPELSLQKVTAYLSVSTSYFSGIFKSYTGVTFVDFLTRIRMHKAQELLVSTDMKNYEIAGRVGYDDPGYFGLTFKKFTGKNPTDYRREFKQDGGLRIED